VADIRVVSPEGVRGSVPEADASSALSNGYQLEAQYDKEQQLAGVGLGEKVLGGAEAFARGATLGLSDLAGDALAGAAAPDLGPVATGQGLDAPVDDRSAFERGFDQARADRQLREESLGGVATGLEAVGALAPTLLSGGAGALSKIAGYAPAALAETAGAKIGGSILAGAGAEGASLARTVLARGAAGAVEGGLGSLGQSAAELRARDIEADPVGSAEAVSLSALTGLGIGAAAGSMFGLAEGGLNIGARAARKAESEALQQAAVPAAPMQSADDIVAANAVRPDLAAAVPEPQRGTIQSLLDKADAPNTFPKQQDEAAAELYRLLDEHRADQAVFDNEVSIATKRKANQVMADELATDPVTGLPDPGAVDPNSGVKLGERHAASKQVLQDVIDEINGYRANLPDADTRGLAPLVKSLEHDMGQMDQAFTAGDFGGAYDVLDQRVRRRIGALAGDTKDSGIKAFLRDLYKRPQAFLEDANTWGPLADAQKLANPTWSDRITKSQDSYWRSLFHQGGEAGADGWGAQRVADSAAVRNLVGQLGGAGSESAELAFRHNLRAAAKDAVNRSAAWGSPEARQLAERMAARAKRMEDLADNVIVKRRDYYAAMRPGSTGQLLNEIPVAGPAVRVASKLATNVVGAARERLGKQIVGAARSAVKAAASKAPAKGVGLAAATITNAERDRMVREANELQSLQSPVTRKMLAEGAEIERSNPEMARSLVQQKLAAAEYIVSKLPVAPSQAMFAPAAKLDGVSQRKLDRTLAAVHNPQAAMQRLAAGSSSPEDLDVVKTLFPATYGKFTQAVANEIQRMKVPPSLQQRLRLSRLTGLPVDASYERLADAQQVAAAAAAPDTGEQQGGGGGSGTIDPDRAMSRMDSILSGSGAQ